VNGFASISFTTKNVKVNQNKIELNGKYNPITGVSIKMRADYL